MKLDSQGYQVSDLLDMGLKWVNSYPDLYKAAHSHAKAILGNAAIDLDPDAVYWHRFDNVQGSPRTFTGWEHVGPPVESMTLVELVLRRFRPGDQLGMDDTGQMGGFYTATPNVEIFDERTEVRLLPKDVSEYLWNADFGGKYLRQLAGFWSSRGNEFVALARADFSSALVRAARNRSLSAADMKLAEDAFRSTFAHMWNVDVAYTVMMPAPAVKITTFDIGGIRAAGILRILGADGREVIYLPGEKNAFLGFENRTALYDWLRRVANNPTQRHELVRHMEAFRLQLPEKLDELTSKLDAIAQDATYAHLGWLNQNVLEIEGDPFVFLRKQAEAEMTSFAEALLTTNNDLRFALALAYLSALNRLATNLAPLAPPLALLAVGVGVATVVVDTEIAVFGHTFEQRKQAAINAVFASIGVLFNVPFLFGAPVETELPWTNPRPAPSPSPSFRVESMELPELPTVPVEGDVVEVNALGMLVRRNFSNVYYTQALSEAKGAWEIINETLSPTRDFNGAQPMLEGDALRVFGSLEGAKNYAKANFSGPYLLAKIEADGLVGASLRENLASNMALTLRRENYPASLIMPADYAAFANGAWTNDEIHLSMAAFSQARIRILTIGDTSRVVPAALPVTDMFHGVLRRASLANPSLFVDSIQVEGVRLDVRYDPVTDTWRSNSTTPYRLNAEAGRFELVDLATELTRNPEQITAATRRFGIDLDYPWTLQEESFVNGQPIPRKIHSVWIGKRLPTEFAKLVKRNAMNAALGRHPFEMHLYLAIDDPVEMSATLLALKDRPGSLHLHALEETKFFQNFRKQPYFDQYHAASKGNAVNYASAVDVLRYRLLHSEGGIYLDVDDKVLGTDRHGLNFGDHEFRVEPGKLLLNNLVSHSRLGMNLEFNTSNIGSLPGNPLLDQISALSHERFLDSEDLYTQRPYESADGRERVDHYAKRISYTTGPEVFNDVVLRQFPHYRQFRGICRASVELYIDPRTRAHIDDLIRRLTPGYSPLGRLIRIGTTGSWMHTR